MIPKIVWSPDQCLDDSCCYFATAYINSTETATVVVGHGSYRLEIYKQVIVSMPLREDLDWFRGYRTYRNILEVHLWRWLVENEFSLKYRGANGKFVAVRLTKSK